MSNTEHHRIDLTAAERERLQELAVQTRSRPTRGTGAYVADWKYMLRRIGRGEIDLVEREPYQLPPGLVEQAEAVEERQREQVQIEQARRKMPVKLQQLSMLDLVAEPV